MLKLGLSPAWGVRSQGETQRNCGPARAVGMRFNSMQREEPYQGLTYYESFKKERVGLEKKYLTRWGKNVALGIAQKPLKIIYFQKPVQLYFVRSLA